MQKNTSTPKNPPQSGNIFGWKFSFISLGIILVTLLAVIIFDDPPPPVDQKKTKQIDTVEIYNDEL